MTRYSLVSADGDRTFELRGAGSLVVGRALKSDIPIIDPTVSRRHAEVRWDDGGVLVRDLGSSNGTFVNGVRIEEARLTAGDVVAFGRLAFRLRESTAVDDAAPGAAASPRGAATILRQLPVPRASNPRVARLRASGPHRVIEETTSPLRESPERTAQKLALLLEVSKGLTRATDVAALLEKIVDFVFQIMDVDRASVLLADDGGALVPHVARDKYGATAGRTVPSSIARTVVEEKVAVLSDNAPEDARFGGESILTQRVRSAMCAPLIGSEDRVLGVLYVDNLTSTNRFGEEDLEFLVAFSGIAAVSIENSQFAERIRHETIVRSNFERFFAPSLAARIASTPDGVRLGGERRPVAVLFSDIRNFTALSEAMRPEETARLLNEYFVEMVDCVFRHGGTLDKFIGDAILAQWGAPLGGPDDADRAMRAAVDMMRSLRALNERWAAEGRPTLAIGIGLSFGEAFAGFIGSERRLEFTVIGDTVNTASRLSAAAAGGEILLSEEMRRALADPPPLRECAPMELKGKSHPVPVYRVEL